MWTTRRLLGAGVIGVVLFAVAFTVMGATRADYEPVRHFVSILSLCDGGWMQILNFVACGVLIVVLCIGVERRWTSGLGARWVPRCLTITGVALAGCGVFIPDPSLGYPPGTPDQLITPLTWHGAIHYLCATTIGVALSAAVLLSIRRAVALGDRALMAISVITVVAVLGGCGLALVLGTGDPVQRVGLFERIGIYAGWGWLAALGLLELRRAE